MKIKLKRLSAFLCACCMVAVSGLSCIPASAEVTPTELDVVKSMYNADTMPEYGMMSNFKTWYNKKSDSELNEVIIYRNYSDRVIEVIYYIYDVTEFNVTFDNNKLNFVNISDNSANVGIYDVGIINVNGSYGINFGSTLVYLSGNINVGDSFSSNTIPDYIECFSDENIYDSNGNVIFQNPNKANLTIDYSYNKSDVADGTFKFDITSDKGVYIVLDLCKADGLGAHYSGNSWIYRYNQGDLITTENHNNIFRYNTGLGEVVTTSKTYSYDDMLKHSDFDLKLEWWRSFWKNDGYMQSQGVSDEFLNTVQVILGNSNVYCEWAYDNSSGEVMNTTSNNIIDFIKAHLTDDMLDYYQQNNSKFHGWNTESIYNRPKYYSCELKYKDTSINAQRYQGYTLLIPDTLKTFEIDINNIPNLEYNSTYYWVVSYVTATEVLSGDVNVGVGVYDLPYKRYYQSFIFQAPNDLSYFEELPYGDGVNNDKNMIYDSNTNSQIGSTVDGVLSGEVLTDIVTGSTSDSFTIKGFTNNVKTVFSLIYNALPPGVVEVFSFLLVAYITLGFLKIILPTVSK